MEIIIFYFFTVEKLKKEFVNFVFVDFYYWESHDVKICEFFYRFYIFVMSELRETMRGDKK